MTRITLDRATQELLHNLSEPLEFCDESGWVLGTFMPEAHEWPRRPPRRRSSISTRWRRASARSSGCTASSKISSSPSILHGETRPRGGSRGSRGGTKVGTDSVSDQRFLFQAECRGCDPDAVAVRSPSPSGSSTPRSAHSTIDCITAVSKSRWIMRPTEVWIIRTATSCSSGSTQKWVPKRRPSRSCRWSGTAGLDGVLDDLDGEAETQALGPPSC